MSFVDNDFKNYIKLKVLDEIFPILNNEQKNNLLNYLIQIINYISIKYNFSKFGKHEDFLYQFKQNSNRDLRALLNLLLPFVDDIDGSKSKKLKNLNDLYVKKKDDNEDKYEFTNIQYSRCIRGNNGSFKEIKYNDSHTRHNFELLKKTIFKCANKSFINWMNIFPMRPDNIKKFDIYKNTKKLWDSGEIQKLADVNEEQCILPFDDIYNTMANYLYEDVKNIKWLIFEKNIDNKPIPFVILLNKYLNLEIIIADKKWDYLQNIDKKRFENEWINLLNNTNDPIINKIFKNLFVSFQKNYKNINKLIDNNLFKKFKFKKEEDEDLLEDTDAELYNDVNIEVLVKCIILTPIRYIYEFMYDCIQQFKKTWYFFNDKNYLTKDNKTKFKDINDGGFFLNNEYKIVCITLKNVYNLCKSFSHYQDVNYNGQSMYKSISKYWRGIPYKLQHKKGYQITRDIIINRLNIKSDKTLKLDKICNNIKDKIKWFNISKYLSNTYNLNDDTVIKEFNCIIFYLIKKEYLLDIIFEILTKKGVLSYFKPSKELTDESLLPEDYISKTKEIKKRMNNKIFKKREIFKDDKNDEEEEHEKHSIKEFEKAYYFLTDKPYKELEKTKEFNKTYFEMVADEFNWQYTYAMDWISQINFFNHYLNNRIIFVTGSTGVGKSSQVPKLLLYALKAIDYKSKGKVVCTQPRVPPTENVPRSIAEQMGVPLKNYSSVYKKEIPTDNFQIQFKHQKNNHTDKNQEYYLKMVTDGTLFEELVNSPICKKLVPMKNKNGDIEKDKNGNTIDDFSTTNLYDIIIVDEAHEHNTNMDMILTVARYSAYYNNSIKLVIISATMDDDEPRYRRYFRCLNDNRSYPFDFDLKENKLDRINIDRRFHISPPGMTTRFKVNEFYENNLTDNQKTWDWSYNRGIERVIEICEISSSGDILFFVTGKREILDAVKKLNKNTPDDVICLPYHGELSSEDKDIIENIHSKLKTITTHKDQVGYDAENDDDIIELKSVSPGTYKRAVIVATNVAEASLTIITLRYVVETGYAKTAKYNHNLRSSILETTEISESSRLQRKGRVGRVADGNVYYTYEKGARQNNITEFKISNQDISNIIYKLLCDYSNEQNLFNEKLDLNVPDVLINFNKNTNFFWDDYFTMIKNKKLYKYDGIISMIEQQYLSINEIIDYYGLDDQNDWKFKGWDYRPPDCQRSGYLKQILLDLKCDFYLVHPNEETLELNKIRLFVTGKPNNDRIFFDKMIDFFSVLQNNLLIIEEYDTINISNHIVYDITTNKKKTIQLNTSAFKTEYGKNLNILASSLDIYLLSDLIPYVYSNLYKCRDEVLNILCMINSGNFSKNLKKFYGTYVNNNNKRRYYVEKFKQLYSNQYGDYSVLLEIYYLIKSVFKNLLVFRDIKPDNFKDIFDNYKLIYNTYIKYNIDKVQKELPLEIYKKMKDLENKNILNTDKDFDYFVKDNFNYLILDIENHESEIIKYCEQVYLNSDSILDYLKYLCKQKYNIWYNNYKQEKNLREENTDKIINIDWFDQNLTTTFMTDNININIILSFIHANGENIGYIINNSKYVHILQKQILTFDKLIKFLDDTESIINNNFSCIMYHSYDNKEFKETYETKINIISNIKLEWLLKLVPYVYNIKEINKKKYTITKYYEDKPDLVITITKALSEFKKEIISYLPIIIENLSVLANKSDININNYFNELISIYKINNQSGGSYKNYIIISRKDKKYKYKLTLCNNKILKMKKIKNG